MTLADLYTLIRRNFRTAYNAFPIGEAPLMPYVCIVCTNTDNFGADNQVYHKRQRVDIELYTEKKDLSAEEILEAILDGAKIFYNATDNYLDDERCWERVYEIEV